MSNIGETFSFYFYNLYDAINLALYDKKRN